MLYSSELYHYGVKGMKWGVRRYVNYDGTLTPKGKAKLDRFKDRERTKALAGTVNVLTDRLAKYQETYAKKRQAEVATSDQAKLDKLNKQLRKSAEDVYKFASRGEAIINEIDKADFNKMQSIKKERRGMALVSGALGIPGGIAYMAISTKRNKRLPGEWLDYDATHKINADSENADYDYQPDAPYRKKKS